MIRKVLAAIAKFIAFVLAVLAVIVAVAALPLFNVGLHLFSPDVYKRALAAQNIYDRLPALAAEQLDLQLHYTGPGLEEGGEGQASTPEPGSGPPPMFQNISRAGWEQLLSTLLPADWLKTQTESALDQTFAMLDSTDPDSKVTISLVELKAHVGGEAGVAAFLQLVRAQPPCSQEELLGWGGAAEAALPICRPPEEILTAATPQIQAMLAAVVVGLPDEADLAQTFAGGGESEQGESSVPNSGEPQPDPRTTLRLIRLGLRLSPSLPLVLLLLVALFGARSRKALLRWWGIPLLVAGLIGVIEALTLVPAMQAGYATFAADKIPLYLSESFVQAGLDVALRLGQTLAWWIGSEAVLIGLSGLVMVAGSRLQAQPAKSTRTAPTAS
ncbi:MAG: hypothetical protein HYZ49_13125 [Chloroflexi bacterium]|nr:hypothetical protein [Chloroflexota bacterium]